MTKSKTLVGGMIDDVKKAAAKIGDVASEATGAAPKKLYERIVPVPPIDTYSELPFALVERQGEAISPGARSATTNRKSRKPSKKTSAASKRTAKKTATPAKRRKAPK